ncbi:SDR family NAD(P)-dependent oxidoreductase [Nocardia sp. NPDC055165]
MQSFTNKVVVITGAGSGIGRAYARNFARLGARLALSDIDMDAVTETADISRRIGAEARAYRLDVADRPAFIAHADEVAQDFGGVDIVINNAGVMVVGELTDVSWEELDWITGININGVLTGSKAFLPHLKASGDGHLVNMSSLWGIVGSPMGSLYSASKFFVRGLSESLRQDMLQGGHAVGVTSVHPGFIKTDFVRSARVSAPEYDSETLANMVDARVRTTADTVAKKVIKGIQHNRARVLIGPDAYLADAVARIIGPGYQRLIPAVAKRFSP